MQTYNVKLISEPSQSFRCTLAANSLDIDTGKKLTHEFNLKADFSKPFNIGVFYGASGSGKTSLAKEIFGEKIFEEKLDENKTILDQLPEEMSYDQCSAVLCGMGLTSVPCWLRPIKTLSNGQRARAFAAMVVSKNKDIIALDEWTSVVDRTVAKAMSACINKYARKNNKKIILLSCHSDVIDWLDPDFIVDCNTQKFIDRRLLCPEKRKRKEQLQFNVREVEGSTWKNFSKYHYLNDEVPRGKRFLFGLFFQEKQIGFGAFINLVPKRKGQKMIMHSTKVVIHPDYIGLGLGLKFVTATSKIITKKNYRVMAKFSSAPMFKARIKDKENWRFIKTEIKIGHWATSKKLFRKSGFRRDVKTHTFEFIGT
jgi:ABC-type dipeptide/oligopeptide/nickel transport system ATPase subunit